MPTKMDSTSLEQREGQGLLRQSNMYSSEDDEEMNDTDRNKPSEAGSNPLSSSSSSSSSSLILLILLWYGSSIICTNTTKTLKIHWTILTLCQMVLSSICGAIGIGLFGLGTQLSAQSTKQEQETDGKSRIFTVRRDFCGRNSSSGQYCGWSGYIQYFPVPLARWGTIWLSFVFTMGFVTLNTSLGLAHVSTVMTLRAAEPVATWLLTLLCLPRGRGQETTSLTQVLSLVPIVAGAALAASGPSQALSMSTSTIIHEKDNRDQEEENHSTASTVLTRAGFVTVMICNVCFAMRNLLTKRLQSQFPDLDNYTLFLQLCILGSLWQALLVVMVLGCSRWWWDTNILLPDFSSVQHFNLPILLLNGITFYLYLQLSWIVLGRIGAVTHSVCNALRRPVICAFGWLVFGGATWEGMVGVLLATLGTLGYARAQQKGK